MILLHLRRSLLRLLHEVVEHLLKFSRLMVLLLRKNLRLFFFAGRIRQGWLLISGPPVVDWLLS